MSRDVSASRPAYVQLAELLKARIAAGEFSPGDQLPTGKALAHEYGVAPNTVLNAIRALRDEGIVSSQQGRGTFVRDGAIEDLRAAASPEFREMSAKLDEVVRVLEDLGGRVTALERTAQVSSRDNRSHS
jgi:GntR family transcriptional regulator